MAKFHLRTEQILQGQFAFKPLNVALVFQVNCPGCFIYALPLAARLHEQYSENLNVLAISTAFEDFDLNTVDNTQKLLDTGEMVGATKAHFRPSQVEVYPTKLKFPVAFDVETFHLNRLAGTPSWVVFDEECHILANWFGHQPEAYIESVIATIIENTHDCRVA